MPRQRDTSSGINLARLPTNPCVMVWVCASQLGGRMLFCNPSPRGKYFSKSYRHSKKCRVLKYYKEIF